MHTSTVDEEVIVADIDDDVSTTEPEQSFRPRRANADAGVERLQMDFHGKGYGSKREIMFVLNGQKEMKKAEKDIQDTYMQTACNVIFTQNGRGWGWMPLGYLREHTQLGCHNTLIFPLLSFTTKL